MKLGLKEIGTVVALATAGCAMDKPTTAISRRQYVDFSDAVARDTITEETIEGIRKRCAGVRLNVMAEFLRCQQDGFTGSEEAAAFRKGMDDEEKCLAMHGLSFRP